MRVKDETHHCYLSEAIYYALNTIYSDRLCMPFVRYKISIKLQNITSPIWRGLLIDLDGKKTSKKSLATIALKL